MASQPSDAELHDIVQRYQVAWGTRAELATPDGTVQSVGYVIELQATPERDQESLASARPGWRAVESALERLQLGHDRQPEMSATITIVHPDGTASRPPDSAQHQRLEAMVGRLRALGAREGSARR
jgi:hypothetical protein